MSSALSDITANLAELRLSGGPLLQDAEHQAANLSALQRGLEQAKGGSLAMLRAQIAATVMASQGIGQQARAAVSAAQSSEQALHAASDAARREVTSLSHDLFERKIFDPYLRFSSAENEEAYRRRETERQHYIEDQLAKGTPEGNLNASGATIAQMRDAEAHGADASPEFQSRMDAITSSSDQLKAEMKAQGKSTAEFDRLIATPESPPTMGASVDPLDAIKPSLHASKDAIASLRAAGVVAPDQTQQVTNNAPLSKTAGPRSV